MRFRRFIACSVVVLSLVATGTWRTSAQGTQPGRETSAASVASTRSPTRCRSIPKSSSARCRTACATTCAPNAQAGAPRRAAARRQGRFGARRRRPAGAGALRRAHGVRRHAALPAAGHRRLPVVARPRASAPDANAATSFDDTQYTLRVPTDVPGVLDRALLVLEDWAQRRHVRSERHRPRARHRPVRVAACTSAPASGPQDKIRRVQLEGSRYADRPPIGNPEIIEHAQREQLIALLPRLVPSGPDGRDRRRRRRSRRRRRR